MMNQEHRRPVTLEDLLRLKRAERPSPEFWRQFDRELRAKQLAALVEKRPWWRVVPRAFAGLSRYHLPLGATAVLALSVISVREFRSAAPATVQPPRARTEPTVAASVPVVARPVAIPVNFAAPVPEAVASADENESESRRADVASESPGAADFAQTTVPAAVTMEVEQVAAKALPRSRLIGDNLVSAQQVAFARDAVSASRGFESRVMPPHAPKVDPLAQMTSPADARRAWLLNATLTSASVSPAMRGGDRVASRLTSDRIYDDTVSRLDAHGNSLGFRF